MIRRTTLLLALLLLLPACARRRHTFVPPHYSDGQAGLEALWRDILAAATADDRERVHDLLATTALSDDELRRLFGPKADVLLPRYHQLIGTLVNRGAVELVAQVYEKKYDAVEALPDKEPIVESALVEPHPLWSVRLRKSTESLGQRYDFFLYLDGKWRTGNQLGKYLEGR